jgi:phage-related tail fiber protein
LRGAFVRSFDNGRGVDVGRGFGTWQGDAIRNIYGNVLGLRWGPYGGLTDGAFGEVRDSGQQAAMQPSGLDGDIQRIYMNAGQLVPTAADNRPVNLALLPCIKY